MICDDPSSLHTVVVSIVNPQGIIRTVTDNNNPEIQSVEDYSNENFILENCDETMFRPVITVLSGSSKMDEEPNVDECSKPVEVPLELVVPVIDERVLEEKKRKKEDDQREKENIRRQQLEKLEAEKEEKLTKEKESQKPKKVIEKESVIVADVKKNVNENKKSAETKKEESYSQTKKNKKAQKYNKKSPDDDKKVTTVTSNIVKNVPSQKVEEKVEESKKEVEEIKVEIETKENIPTIQKVDVVEEPAPVKSLLETEVEGIQETPKAVDIEPNNELEIVEGYLDLPTFETKSIEDVKVSEEFVENFEVVVEKELEPQKDEKLEITQVTVMEPKLKPEILVETEPLVKEEIPAKKQSENPDKDAWKRNKKGKKKNLQLSKSEAPKLADFPPLVPISQVVAPPPIIPLPAEIKLDLEKYNKEVDQDAIMKISQHETIGDEEIQIVPHEETVEIHDSPRKSVTDIEIIEENFIEPILVTAEINEALAKHDNLYDDIDDDLPPLEPFDPTFDSDFNEKKEEEKTSCDDYGDDEELKEKQAMKKKMSELLKDTNMVFAMCSSLKELKVDEESKSMSSSSHIQRSTSSSVTTNTTTSTFASANSNQCGEGHDSDYKSIDLEIEEAIVSAHDTEENTGNESDQVFKVPKTPLTEKEDPEDISSFEATSSETDADDSSKKSNIITKFKREDDEELRPLLETSTTSLSTPSSTAGGLTMITTLTTTEANEVPTLPETNQKSQETSNNNTSNNNGKRKNKKKRR